MKAPLLFVIFAATFLICVHLERPVRYRTPANERALERNEANPSLRKIGDAWPLPPGTPVWFHADRTSFATVLETEGDAALIEVNAGGSNWVRRKVLQKAWIVDAREGR
jgi:hypothetical protein